MQGGITAYAICNSKKRKAQHLKTQMITPYQSCQDKGTPTLFLRDIEEAEGPGFLTHKPKLQ